MMDLNTLRHCQVTNLAAGRINNQDAALVVLHSLGGTAHYKAITSGLQAWRGGLHFNYLFQMYHGCGGYGFTGKTFESPGQQVHHITSYKRWDLKTRDESTYSGYSFRNHYWYRKSPGIYAITAAGLERLTQLGITAASKTN